MPPSAEYHQNLGSDDDLIEIHSTQFNPPSSTPRPFVNSETRRRPSPTDGSRLRPRSRAIQQFSSRPNSRPQQPDAIIDLTEEPDSPVQVRSAQLPSSNTNRHPRRTNSQNITPPRLSRSESILLDPFLNGFIDLTNDDDNDMTTSTSNNEPSSRIGTSSNRRSNRNNHRPSQPSSQQPPLALGFDPLVNMSLMQQARHSHLASSLARGVERTIANFIGSGFMRRQLPTLPVAPLMPNMHRSAGGGVMFPFASGISSFRPSPRQPSPLREEIPLPPTTEGFTRSTCAEPNKDGVDGDERVVVCPGCDEELAYDPADSTVQPVSSSSRKRKRGAGDHHFWAVKKCGHVYCADCFENRRPTKAQLNSVPASSNKYRFPFKSPYDIRCAVDKCESKVTNKTEWVGIFL